MQGYRDTGIQKYNNGNINTGIQGYRNTTTVISIQRYRDTRIPQQFINTEIKALNIRVLGHERIKQRKF